MRLALVVGNTDTASIPGISAAGTTPELARHTPAADAELVVYGRTVLAPTVPTSPSGCPTPALLTRATRELLGFDVLVVNAGISAPTAAPVVAIGGTPGGDIRDPEPVPCAGDVYDAAFGLGSALGRSRADDRLLVGESVPGGTTTALGVLRALGEPHAVSSSLSENPIDRKREVVEEGMVASGIAEGDAAGSPRDALRLMGDPVLAGTAGLAAGASAAGTDVRFAGGTQLVAAAALLRHGGVDDPLPLATTRFVDDDPTVDIRAAAAALELDLTITDPGFRLSDHPALAAFARGEAKEGVGLGGALASIDRSSTSMATLRARVEALYAEVCQGGP